MATRLSRHRRGPLPSGSTRRLDDGDPRRPRARPVGLHQSGAAPSATTASSGALGPPAGPPTAAQKTAVADGATPADTDSAGVEWLCRPGQRDDPCTSSLTTTVDPRSGPVRLQRASDAAHPGIDCFYVYPTVSLQ